MRRRISDSTMRSRVLSKPSLRPASCTGWNVTPRTQRHSSAWRTISPISSSLTPRLTVTTSVVEMPWRSRFSSASCAHAPQVGAAQIHQRVALERIELQIDFEPALALGQPRDEIRLRAMRMPLVLIITWRIGRAPHRVEDGEELRMQRRLAARDLHQVGLAFARHQRVEHALDRRRAAGAWLRAGEESAKQTGQVRLQCSLISISARQECCS